MGIAWHAKTGPQHMSETASTCHVSPQVNATKCKVIQSSVYLKIVLQASEPQGPLSINHVLSSLIMPDKHSQATQTGGF